eukprot:SAG22_NODE_1583_length_4063_cov_6.137487_2_plen_906_part_00
MPEKAPSGFIDPTEAVVGDTTEASAATMADDPKTEDKAADPADLAVEEKAAVESDICPIRRGSCREVELLGKDCMGAPVFKFNPVVSLLGAALLWGFVIAILVMSGDDIEVTAASKMATWQSWVTATFTWLYIGSQDIWIVFMLAVYWFYGDVKLGKAATADDPHKPEFSDSTYFMMVFCSGVAVGLFFYGVSEPLYHLNSHRFAAAGYHNDNEKAQYAIDLTIYHWGLHGFIVYTLVAVVLGFVSFKKGLTLSIRSCFYPVLGDRIYGWVGDVIDSFSIFTVVAGVCTSLGLGVMQIVTGLQRLEVLDANCPCVGAGTCDETSDAWTADCLTDDNLTSARVLTIWIITAVATASVVSGLQYGIKALSQLAFCMALFLWLMVFMMEDTWFFLNLMTQTTGSYLSSLTALGFRTDAFSQLKKVDGGAPDDLGGATAWMDWWTIFYWGWWIAWSPFVGMFVAKISKNRTIKEVCHVTLTGPLFFAIMWFAVFGGTGIKHNRQASFIEANAGSLQVMRADAAGVMQQTTLTYDLATEQTNGACFNVPNVHCQTEVDLYAAAAIANNATYAVPALLSSCSKTGFAFGEPSISPVCKNGAGDGSWFDVMESLYGMGKFLDWWSLFTIVFYFCTSSDSGSLVVDALASNGSGFAEDEKVSVIQRVFWALTEGGVASALLVAGGRDSLKALQAASICAGLPYTILLCIMCTSLWRMLKEDAVNPDVIWVGAGRKNSVRGPQEPAFKMDLCGGIFEVIEVVFSAGRTSKMPVASECVNTIVAVFCPAVGVLQVLNKINKPDGDKLTLFKSASMYNTATAVSVGLLYYLFVIFMFIELAEDGFWALGWVAYIFFAFLLSAVRATARADAGIDGNPLEDFFAALFAFPAVIAQIQAGSAAEAAAEAASGTLPVSN